MCEARAATREIKLREQRESLSSPEKPACWSDPKRPDPKRATGMGLCMQAWDLTSRPERDSTGRWVFCGVGAKWRGAASPSQQKASALHLSPSLGGQLASAIRGTPDPGFSGPHHLPGPWKCRPRPKRGLNPVLALQKFPEKSRQVFVSCQPWKLSCPQIYRPPSGGELQPLPSGMTPHL